MSRKPSGPRRVKKRQTTRRAEPLPQLDHPFAAERALSEVQALLEGQQFENIDDINAHLRSLMEGGRLSQRAQAWKRDDPKWKAQQLAYDALETDDLETALLLISEALKLDPNCTDANRLMVSLLPAELENKVQLMREVVETAERNFGEKFMQEHTGHFWGEVATRPYMRAKQHFGELLVECGKTGDGIAVFEQMLTLNPNDNQGMRYKLLALYLAAGRPEAAASVLSRHKGEEHVCAIFAWARVLERWLVSALEEAGTSLKRARQVNRFVEPYLTGARRLPRQVPEAFIMGDDSEAQACAHELMPACRAHPEFAAWLRHAR